MCFTIARPRPGAAGAAGAVGAVEALEQARELVLGDAGPVVGGAQLAVSDGERERRSVARVAERVAGEVLDHDAQHPRPQRQLGLLVALGAQRHPGADRRLLQLVERLADHGERAGRVNATTVRPVSSSLRNSTSSISSPICSTSARACVDQLVGVLARQEAVSSSASTRASGVRSSCETAAVKPARSSS